MPTRYASPELLIRAFSELLFAAELHLDDPRIWVPDGIGEWGDIYNFFELPCFQRCQMLRLCNSDIFYPLKGQLVDWLFSGGPKKSLAIRVDTSLVSLLRKHVGGDSVLHVPQIPDRLKEYQAT